MPTPLFEKSSVKVIATFRDYNDTLFTPKTLWYALYGSHGKVVIARTQVTSGLSTSYTWVFKGAQLDISDPRDDGKRYIVVDGTFDTITETDVDFVAQYQLPDIKNVIGK